MRAFRISLALFILMSLLVVSCTAFGRKTCENMHEMVAALPDTPQAQSQSKILEIQRYWGRCTHGLRATVNRTVVRSIGDLVEDLVVYSDVTLDSEPEYRSTRARLLGAIDEMHRSTKATFGLWC